MLPVVGIPIQTGAPIAGGVHSEVDMVILHFYKESEVD